MKKFTLAILAVLCLCGTSQQASAQATPGSDRYFSVGPVLTFGMSTFAGEVAETYKIKPKFGFNFGALTQLDISDAVAFNLGLTYESRARYWYKEANEDIENYTAELGYLTVSPLFNFRHVLVGFGIRLPMSGTLIVDRANKKTNEELP
jgi:hypothetical protein